MKFEECYPLEIIEWAQTLPAPDACTLEEMRIASLLEDSSIITLGRGLIKRINDTASREVASAMICNFQRLIQDAAQHA